MKYTLKSMIIATTIAAASLPVVGNTKPLLAQAIIQNHELSVLDAPASTAKAELRLSDGDRYECQALYKGNESSTMTKKEFTCDGIDLENSDRFQNAVVVLMNKTNEVIGKARIMTEKPVTAIKP